MSSTVVEPIPRGTLGSRVGRTLWDWLPAVVVFVAAIALWEGLVRGLDIQNFLLPPPSDQWPQLPPSRYSSSSTTTYMTLVVMFWGSSALMAISIRRRHALHSPR